MYLFKKKKPQNAFYITILNIERDRDFTSNIPCTAVLAVVDSIEDKVERRRQTVSLHWRKPG